MIPDLRHIVEQCKAVYPQAWKDAHTGNAHTEDFIRLCAPMLKAADARFGLNGKRGDPKDISDDAVNVKGEGPGTDKLTGLPCTVIDIIGGAGGPHPQVQWGVMTDPVASSGAWVNPSSAPVPQPPQMPPYSGDPVFDAVGVVLFADYAQAGNAPDAQMGRWFGRTIYDWLAQVTPTLDASIAKHRAEWRAVLGLPPLP